MERLQVINGHFQDQNAKDKKEDLLLVTDSRTGKNYKLPIRHGAINAKDLQQIKAPGSPVLRSYDPGYTNTACCVSRIAYLDGANGILQYRGYPIEQLAEGACMEEVMFLLLYGELPRSQELETFRRSIQEHSVVPNEVLNVIRSFDRSAHPMGMLMAAMAALGTVNTDSNPAIAGQGVYKEPGVRNKQIVRVLGAVPTMAAAIERHRSGLPPVDPNPKLGFTENFLFMMDARGADYRPHPKLVKALDVLFILHAEHELNCSTSAVRHLASSNVDVYTALAGGVGALYGPRHGGANEAVVRMLEKIGSVRNIPDFIKRVKQQKEMLMGFGHRVYKNYDPRARVVRKIAEDVFRVLGREPLIDVAMELEKIALSEEYFVKRKLYPNVDFYSGLIYKALGFSTAFFPVLFAIPRTSGWLAHWNEFQADPDNKICRPYQIYQGEAKRDFKAPRQRPTSHHLSPVEVEVPWSAAQRRRMNGVNE